MNRTFIHGGLTLIAALTMITVLIIGCGDDPASVDDLDLGSRNATEFQEVIDNSGDYVDPTPIEDIGPEVAAGDSLATNGTLWACTTREVDIVDAPEELFLFAESGLIYPGAMMQGSTLDQNPPSPIALPRGSGTIAIDLTTGEGDSTFIDLAEISASRVGNAINDLVRGRTLTPSRIVVNSENVRSKEELQIKMKLSGSGFGFSGAAQFKFRSDKEYTRRLVTLQQVFFKARFDRSLDASDWFAPSVTVEDFEQYAGAGNPPVYVREVTYGRLIYVLIEAVASETEIDSKVNASYSGLTGSGSIVAEQDYVGKLQDVQLTAVVYGGTISGALETAFGAEDYNAFNSSIGAMLGEQQVPGGGLPLSYTMYEVKDDRAVRAKLATKYTLRDCRPVLSSLDDPLVFWNTDAQKCGAGAGGLDPVTVFSASRTEFEVLGQDDLGAGDPWWNGNPCSQHTGCIGGGSVPCPPWTPDWQTGMFRTSGTCQANRATTNENLVEKVADEFDPSGGPALQRVNSDSAPSRIDYLDRTCVGKVIQFHQAPPWYLDTYPDATWAQWGYPAKYARSEMFFDGTALLANTDYTMFLVAQVPNRTYHKTVGCNCDGLNEASNPGGNVIYSSTGDTSFQFRLARTSVGVRHQGTYVGGNAGLDDAWHVYAVRFSQDKGVSVFRDGALLYSNPNVKAPITNFPNARIGAQTAGCVVRFRSAEVYGSAGSDQAIADRTTEIRGNLGI